MVSAPTRFDLAAPIFSLRYSSNAVVICRRTFVRCHLSSYVRSLFRSSVRPFVRSFLRSYAFVRACLRSLMRSFTHSFAGLLTCARAQPTPGFRNSFPLPSEEPASERERVSACARDLIVKLLQSDPVQRLSAREALEHPWLAGSADDSRALSVRVVRSVAALRQLNEFQRRLLELMVNTLSQGNPCFCLHCFPSVFFFHAILHPFPHFILDTISLLALVQRNFLTGERPSCSLARRTGLRMALSRSPSSSMPSPTNCTQVWR
jgi:serine/threonine protein kinase